PTGNVLKEQIGEGVRLKRDGDYNFGEIILRSIPKNPAWRVSYRDAGRQLAETLSTFPSIDEALHWWRDSKEIVELGKLSIAYFILRAERQSHLQFKPQTGRVEVDNVAHSWFRHFMSIALSGLDRGKAEKAFENVTLINFNYDRTIEHYLFH